MRGRRFALSALLACSLGLLLAAPAAESASVATRAVTVNLSGSGKATWTITGAGEESTVTMTYSWRGVLKFPVPAVALSKSTSRFTARASSTFVASWTGRYAGTLREGTPRGEFNCLYTGRSAPSGIGAILSNGPSKKKVQIVVHPRGRGFFPVGGTPNAAIECSNSYGEEGPPHFSPNWFFRDNFLDRGKMTRNTAYFIFDRTVLRGGKTTIRFPYEVGRRNSNFTGNTTWNNKGRLAIRVS